jgi:hypothetical protein
MFYFLSTAQPQAPGPPSRAGVDPALPLDEPVQWLGIQLAPRSVTHDARPFAPCPFVGLGGVVRRDKSPTSTDSKFSYAFNHHPKVGFRRLYEVHETQYKLTTQAWGELQCCQICQLTGAYVTRII